MDIKHFYVEKGQGDPIILMHGNGEDCSIFNGQIDVFAQHYHVYWIRGVTGKRREAISLLSSVSLRMICWALWMSTRSRRRMCSAFRTAAISL